MARIVHYFSGAVEFSF